MNGRLLLIGALGFAAALSTNSGTAEADGHVRFSGGGHFRGGGYHGGVHVGGGYRGGVHFARPAWRGGYYRGYGYGYRGGYRGGYRSPYYRTGGRIWVGGGGYYNPYYYYRPYYYSYYYAPEAVPSYYPVAPGPTVAAPGVAAQGMVAIPQRELPKFGIGLFAGGISVEGVDQSSDVGVLGRLRLGNGGLVVEGELAKTSFKDDERVDRRLGGSLIYEFGARNALAPYVLVGLGVNQAQVGDGYNTTQDFAEVGVGLRLALSEHIHLALDVRAGSRGTVSSDDSFSGNLERSIAPPPANSDDTEQYTRARLSAILMF